MGLSLNALGRCRDIKGLLFSERNANANTKSFGAQPRSQSPTSTLGTRSNLDFCWL